MLLPLNPNRSLSKEVSYYEKEVAENEAKLKEMKEQKKNPYDIKKFEEVLGESYMMVPDSRNRLETALSELCNFVKSAEVEGLETNEWYTSANVLLAMECSPSKEPDDIVEETDTAELQEGEAF